MKQILFLLAAVLLCSCSATPKKFAPPSTTGVHSSISETRGHIANAGQDAKEAKEAIANALKLAQGNDALVLQLGEANTRIDRLTQSLLAATSTATEADVKLSATDKKMVAMTNEINKREVKAAAAINRYHRLKTWLCLAVAGLAGFLVWQFKPIFLALGPYGWGFMAAIPVLAYGVAWLIL